jgi:hypothetical protein
MSELKFGPALRERARIEPGGEGCKWRYTVTHPDPPQEDRIAAGGGGPPCYWGSGPIYSENFHGLAT